MEAKLNRELPSSVRVNRAKEQCYVVSTTLPGPDPTAKLTKFPQIDWEWWAKTDGEEPSDHCQRGTTHPLPLCESISRLCCDLGGAEVTEGSNPESKFGGAHSQTTYPAC